MLLIGYMGKPVHLATPVDLTLSGGRSAAAILSRV